MPDNAAKDNGPYDNSEPEPRAAIPSPNERDRCIACGRFLAHDSYYRNRCSDCWTPADEIGFYPTL